MYIPQVTVSSLMALVISTLGHSGIVLLWFKPSSSFLLGLDLQVGFLVEWFCILPSEELLNSFPPTVMRGLHTSPSFLPKPVERMGAATVGKGIRNTFQFWGWL